MWHWQAGTDRAPAHPFGDITREDGSGCCSAAASVRPKCAGGSRRNQRSAGLALALCALATAAAGSPPVRSVASDIALSPDGAYVLDVQLQVAWPRCVEGMQWNGSTCTGAPLLLTQAQAQALARDGGRDRGLPLRLPRVAELQRLVQRSGHPPGLDAELFPASPPDWHWSATGVVDTRRVNAYAYGNVVRGLNEQNAVKLKFLHGWAVNLSTGDSRANVARRTKLPVRLLLPLD